MASLTPKVSVVIPTRNRRDLLISAITSVLRQTFQDFEIIVVDDCSEDDTRTIVKEMNNSKVRYICHGGQKGEAAARNTGIKNAKGEFIAFLDDDDVWLPEKLALQVELLENRGEPVGAVYTGYKFVNLASKETLTQKIPEKRGDIYKDLLRDNVIGTPSTVLLRKEVIKKVGFFDEKLPYYVDYDFFLRISKYYNFEYISLPLAIYYVHKDMLSKDPDILLNGLVNFSRKYSNKRGENLSNIFISKAYYKIGMLFCNHNNLKLGRNMLLKSFLCNPYNLKSVYYLFSSFFGINNFYKMKSLPKYFRKSI